MSANLKIQISTPDGKSYLKYMIYPDHTSPKTNMNFMTQDFAGSFPEVPFIEICDIYVEPEKRNTNIGSSLIQHCVEDNKNKVILVAVGASKKEYPEEPSDDDKIKIANEVSKFYEKNNFVDVNKYIAGYEFKRAMMYIGNEIGKKTYDNMKSDLFS